MPRHIFSELRRRNVWRAGALYAAAAWLLVQVATQVFPLFEVPAWVLRWIVIAAAIGFPFWIAFAWLYEFTPEGIKRETELGDEQTTPRRTDKRLDRWIIGILSVAVVLLLANTFVWNDHGARAGSATANSIAVLPFANVSSDREQEYFADGISEDVLDLLTKVSALCVAARTSSFAFKGKEMQVREIARQLNVANVLQGSVRKAGDQVRITAQLVHAADGFQVWSQTWDRKLDDVFAIQDEIAADVAGQLKVKLLGAAPTTRQTDPQAYALFLQARHLGRRLDMPSLAQSDSLYKQALAIDPQYAAAWTELGRNLENEGVIGPCCNMVAKESLAKQAAEKAIAVDPKYAPARAQLGRIALRQGDLAGAASNLERALSLDPSDLDVLSMSADLLSSLGRLPEAIQVRRYVTTRDPVNANSIYGLSLDYLFSRRFDEAIATDRTLLTLSPGYGTAHYAIGVALMLQGKADSALAEIQQETDAGWKLLGEAMVYHALGRFSESKAALSNLETNWARDAAYNIAYVYAYCGNADRAFWWLDKAVEYHDTGVTQVPAQNLFDNIRSDPRWLKFLRRVGEAPEQLAKINFHVALPET